MDIKVRCIENNRRNTNFTLNQEYKVVKLTNGNLGISNDWAGYIDLKRKDLKDEFEVGLCKFIKELI